MADKAKIAQFVGNWNRSKQTIIKMYKLHQEKAFNPKEYQKKLKKYRNRSISYLRSGWIPALKALGGWAKELQRCANEGPAKGQGEDGPKDLG